MIHATEVNFTLTPVDMSNEIRVGGRVKFTLEIIFPLQNVDMLVELFTPDNETTVMILCNVVVRHIGLNLAPSVGTPTVVLDSQDNDNVTRVSKYRKEETF